MIIDTYRADLDSNFSETNKLTRKSFYEAITFIVKMRGNLSSPESIVLHSSTAQNIMEDICSRREGKSLNPHEKITTDIDIWASYETINSIINYLKINNILFTFEEEKSQFQPGFRNFNLIFNHKGVVFDIWTIEGKVDWEDNIEQAMITRHDIADVNVITPSGTNFNIKVIRPGALRELYERLHQYDLNRDSDKASQRLHSQAKTRNL